MTSKDFDIPLHRLASLSNIINVSDVDLYNSETLKLISLYLGCFCSIQSILISLKILLKLDQWFVQKVGIA